MRKLLAIFTLAAVATTAIAAPHERMMSKSDSDGDGLISLDEFHDFDRGMFQRMDSNGDGVVTQDEIEMHMQEMQSKMTGRHSEMQSRIEGHFTQADTNQDGMVTSEEAKSAAFSRIDEDADGYLSSSELQNARQHRKQGRHGHHGSKHGHHGSDPETGESI